MYKCVVSKFVRICDAGPVVDFSDLELWQITFSVGHVVLCSSNTNLVFSWIYTGTQSRDKHKWLHGIPTCMCGWLCGQTRRKASRETEDDSDGDSSVCEELIEEPVKEDLTSKEQITNEDRFVIRTEITTPPSSLSCKHFHCACYKLNVDGDDLGDTIEKNSGVFSLIWTR